MERRRAPGGGRKPKGNYAGKSAAFSTRITPELRAMLDEESERTGQSISQIVEKRLRDSFDQPKKMEKALGPAHIRALAYMVARLATGIEAATELDWRKDEFTGIALREAVVKAINFFRANGAKSNRDKSAAKVPEGIKKQIDAYKYVMDVHGDDQDRDLHLRLYKPENFGVQHLYFVLRLFGERRLRYLEEDAMQSDINNDEFRRDDETLVPFIAKNLKIGGLE